LPTLATTFADAGGRLLAVPPDPVSTIRVKCAEEHRMGDYVK